MREQELINKYMPSSQVCIQQYSMHVYTVYSTLHAYNIIYMFAVLNMMAVKYVST